MTLEDVDLVEKSSVTARGYRHRTTIPSEIFKKLDLKDKDELKWILLKNGTIMLSKIKKAKNNATQHNTT